MKTMKMLTICVMALGLMVCEVRDASAGTLAAWGRNNYGQCDAPAGNDFVAISAGAYHGLTLKSDGSLAAWGISDGSAADFGQVTDAPSGNDFIAVAAGNYHSLALKSDGSLSAWGYNDYGQCDVPAGNDFAAIAAGGLHSLALKSDGSLSAWGYNDYGQCDVPAGNDFAAVAGGGFHSLALKSDGSLAAWGYNDTGACNVPAGNDFIAISAGSDHSLALKSDGSLVAWGNNGSGQCNVPAGNDFVAVSAGGDHSIALKSDGSLVAWGDNTYGQCDVPAGNDFVAVSGGHSHSLAISGSLGTAISTSFTYQGHLLDDESPADGLYDFEFKLYDATSAGAQQGSTITIDDLDVIDGYFTVELDFNDANAFNGDGRWLEIDLRPGESTGSFTTLSPRQEVTAVPYALYALQTRGIFADAGRVGIGTTTPQNKLDVEGSVAIGANYSGTETAPTNGMIIEGNVGIGTTSPAAVLHIGGTAGVDGIKFPDGTLQTTASTGGGDITAVNAGTGLNGGGTSGDVTLGINVPLELSGLSSDPTISATNSGIGHGVSGLHTNSTETGYGVYGDSSKGYGVYGTYGGDLTWGGLGGISYGVYGSCDRVTGTGVVGRGPTSGVYGYHPPTGNYGRLGGPNFGVKSFGDIVVSGDIVVHSGAYRGNISSSSGSDGAPFPRPAYDSGWVSINQDQTKTLTHNIYGDPNNYVVDLQFRDIESHGSPLIGTHIRFLGGDNVSNKGAYWQHLTNTTIEVYRWDSDYNVEKFRIRIWVYN